MRRKPEPLELMSGSEQALAYASADFSEPHDQFIRFFKEAFLGQGVGDDVLDLGCGPADICIRFAQAFPKCRIDGIDGADAMLALGAQCIEQQAMQSRIRLQRCYLPNDLVDFLHAEGTRRTYQTLISNSLLHHLLDPMTLWSSISQLASANAKIFVMDLMRPHSENTAQLLVNTYAADAPEILQQDFYRSLLAAYTVDEVQQQLQRSGLTQLTVQAVSDRHLIVSGRL